MPCLRAVGICGGKGMIVVTGSIRARLFWCALTGYGWVWVFCGVVAKLTAFFSGEMGYIISSCNWARKDYSDGKKRIDTGTWFHLQ